MNFKLLTSALVIFTTLVVVMTWPLGRVTAPAVPASDDAYFSMWRLAWIAHQLQSDPAHLFDANIFHPVTGTLAFSDAMLLVGVMATPLIWLGIDLGIVHNLLLLTAFVSSMLCAFALARRLSGSDSAAFIAAIVFGLAPYRMAHIGHLELQWTMWMPLSMLLLHRLMEHPSAARGVLLGAAVGAQVLCSIYYGAFLSCYLAMAWMALLPFETSKKRVAAATAAALLPLLVVVLIYGPPYSRTRDAMGPRRVSEVQRFSAVPSDYLRVPVENRLRGSQDSGPAPDERSLYPGAIAIALAAAALIPPISRLTLTYLGLGVAAFDLSLGVNGILFGLLSMAVPIAGSLRAPARFGVLVLLSIAVLAAIGSARLFRRNERMGPFAALLVTLLCAGEYWSAPLPARSFDGRPTEVDRWLAAQPPGTVLLELPAPTGSTLWLAEPEYQLRSVHHWQPLVNGYSGFPPEPYVRLINELPKFPERGVILELRKINVRFILVHQRHYAKDEFDRLVAAINASTRLRQVARFGGSEAPVLVYELNYDPE